jgi:hypothetical protein
MAKEMKRGSLGGSRSGILGVGSGMFAGLDFDFVDYLLDIGDFFGQLFGFFLLPDGLYCAFEDQGAVLG